MQAHGPSKAAAVAKATGVARAATLMRADHYGWFERVERGVYGLTPSGEVGLQSAPGVVDALKAELEGLKGSA